MFNGIRRRLVAWNVLVLGLLLAVVSGVMYLTLAHSLLAAVDQNLAGRGDQAAGNLHELTEHAFQFGREGYQGGLFYLLAAPDGRLLANPQGVQLTSLPADVTTTHRPRYAAIPLAGEAARVYVRPLPDATSPAVLVVGQSLEPREQTLQRLLLVLLATAGTGLLLALGGAWFLAGRALVPIQRSVSRQQAFIADASHELRTPLAVLRVAADLLYQRRHQPPPTTEPLIADLRLEIARLERLAGDLLTLARSDLGEVGLAVGELDLAALVGDVVRRTLPVAEERGIALRSAGTDEAVQIEGDPDRLQQVVLILLDNALKYTPAGGQVGVQVARRMQQVTVEIRDSGEGIAEEHAARVFDRFYRVDVARSSGGAGLGLPIAQTLVQAHGGRMHLTSTPGKGTVVTIQLPLMSRSPSFTERVGYLTGRHTDRRPSPAARHVADH
jgi:two-component system sensor histidine kinase CiaH